MSEQPIAEQLQQAYVEAMQQQASGFLQEITPWLDQVDGLLVADMFCSMLAASSGSSEGSDDQAALAALQQSVARVVVQVTTEPTAEGVKFLRAADTFVPPELRDMLETAVGTAVAAGIEEPAWAHRPPLKVKSCWRWAGPAGEVVSVAFGGPDHVMAVHLDSKTHGIYDVDMYEALEEAKADQKEAFAPAGMTREQLTVAEATALLQKALAVPADLREAGDDALHPAVALRQLLGARVREMAR